MILRLRPIRHGLGRHRVQTVTAPGVTPPQSFDSQPASAQCPVRFNGLEKVMRATRLEPAPRRGSAEQRKHRGDEQLISADTKTNQRFHVEDLSTPARVASVRHSSWICENVASTALCRAMRTSQQPVPSNGRSTRTISRKRRRTRFRATAVPTRREVMIPIRAEPSVS
jgi:hypothetical protein